MTSRNIQKRNFNFLFEEIVVGEGFTAGLFYSIGVDPDGTILSTTMQVATAVNPSADLTPFKLVSVVLTILTLVSLFVAYMLGGLLGLLSILIALVSGLIIIEPILKPI
jgi:hypothetical protein